MKVFAANLRDLLLAAPAGGRADDRARPGLPHRGQGRGRRRDRQDRRHDGDLSARAAAPMGREHRGARGARRPAQGRADRDRQRHGLARDRPARRRSHRAPSGAQADQGDGVGSGRVGLFGLGLCGAGTARARRDPARGGLDRAAPAGSARRAGQDRPEVDRRRPVPARPLRAEARPLARRGRGRLRQRGRRRRQHRLGQAAGARLGRRRGAGAGDRRPSRDARALPQPRGAEGGAAPRRKSLRAQRRLSARQPRRPAARPLGRPPGSLSGGPPHPRPARGRHFCRDRQCACASGPEGRRFRRRKVRRADGRRHSEGAREARPRSPPGLQDGGVQGGGRTRSPT